MPSALDDAVVAALDRTWAKIQTLAPKVPDAVWYLTSGRSTSCATGPWNNPGELILRLNLKRPVLDTGGSAVLVAEGDDKGTAVLENRDGSDLLGQLLHWAAHAASGVAKAAEGRYHSRDFGDVAEVLGLVVKYREGVGYAPVTATISGQHVDMLSQQGRDQFRAEIRAIDKAMKTWEPVVEEAPRKRSRGPLALECSCRPPRWVRAQLKTAIGPDIICSVCGEPFRIRPGQRYSEADRV